MIEVLKKLLNFIEKEIDDGVELWAYGESEGSIMLTEMGRSRVQSFINMRYEMFKNLHQLQLKHALNQEEIDFLFYLMKMISKDDKDIPGFKND